MLRELGRSGDQEGRCLGPETNPFLSLSGTQVFSLTGPAFPPHYQRDKSKGQRFGLKRESHKGHKTSLDVDPTLLVT